MFLCESNLSVFGLRDRLHLLGVEEFFVMVIERLGQGDPLRHRARNIELLL